MVVVVTYCNANLFCKPSGVIFCVNVNIFMQRYNNNNNNNKKYNIDLKLFHLYAVQSLNNFPTFRASCVQLL